jgi:hypothetical protein
VSAPTLYPLPFTTNQRAVARLFPNFQLPQSLARQGAIPHFVDGPFLIAQLDHPRLQVGVAHQAVPAQTFQFIIVGMACRFRRPRPLLQQRLEGFLLIFQQITPRPI